MNFANLEYRRRPTVDDEPILYKIYDGKVTKTVDFGAFISLEGVKGRREGLVHVSELSVCCTYYTIITFLKLTICIG